MSIIDIGTPAAASRGKSASGLEAALLHLLPGREQRLLLGACLWRADAAAQAWSGFVAAVGNPKRYFESDETGLKGLLPFVGDRLLANGIDAGKAFQTYARVALVREELRSKIYADILSSLLQTLNAAGVASVLLKGGAVSATVYPQPSARHNHAIDLLVDAAHMAAASVVLREQRFAPGPAGAGARSHQDYRHWTGLALGLHTRPFFLPHFDMPREDILARVRSIERDCVRARVMSPEHNLVHVCGHAMYSRSRTSLRWACDAFYLVESNPPLEWQVVIDSAERARLGLQMFVALRWLRDALGAGVPDAVLAELSDRSRAADAVAREGIFAALVHTRMSWARALECCRDDRRTALEFLRFSALPSPRYLYWRHNSDRAWMLPVYYAQRPLRYAMSVARRLLLGSAQPGGAAEGGSLSKAGAVQ